MSGTVYELRTVHTHYMLLSDTPHALRRMPRAQNGASAWAILSTYYEEIRLRSLQEITIPEGSGVWGR